MLEMSTEPRTPLTGPERMDLSLEKLVRSSRAQAAIRAHEI